jgi:hypothetical protein
LKSWGASRPLAESRLNKPSGVVGGVPVRNCMGKNARGSIGSKWHQRKDSGD